MNVKIAKKKSFWVVTHKFAVEEFSETAQKLKHSWIPFPEPLMYSNTYTQYKDITVSETISCIYCKKGTMCMTYIGNYGYRVECQCCRCHFDFYAKTQENALHIFRRIAKQ